MAARYANWNSTAALKAKLQAQLYYNRKNRRELLAPTPKFLPVTSATKLAVFAPNLVVKAYKGPLFRLVRTSDSATMDVMPKLNGWPNYSEIDGWVGASTATVSEVCNQLGTGIGDATNLTQTAAALRPCFTSLNMPNGKRGFGCHTLAYNTGLANIPRFRIPTAISLSRQNFGVHFTFNPRGSLENRAWFSFDNGVSSDLTVLYSNQGGPSAPGVFGMNPGTTTTRLKSQLQTMAFTGGTNYKLYKDGAILTGAATTAQVMNTGGNVGGSNGDASYTSQADYYSMVFFSTTPSDADITAMNAWAAQVYPLPSATPTKRLVYGGSSLITSWYSTLGQTSLFQMGLDYNTWDAYADCAGGQSLATQYTNRATDAFPLYDGSKSKNVLVFDAPSNDIANATYANQAAAEAGADSIYNTTTLAFVTAAKAQGFAVVVPTIIARGSFDTTTNFKQYALLRYNLNVVSGAVANGYTVADRYADSRLQNASDGTYFNTGDNTHLINAGYAVMAAIDKAAILSA